MKQFNEEESCECIVCSLTDEFTLMIQDGVHYESALRHVLGIAVTSHDEQLAEKVDEAYKEGMVETLREIADFAIEMADDLEDINTQVETLDDLSDEEFNDIQESLRKQIEKNS